MNPIISILEKLGRGICYTFKGIWNTFNPPVSNEAKRQMCKRREENIDDIWDSLEVGVKDFINVNPTPLLKNSNTGNILYEDQVIRPGNTVFRKFFQDIFGSNPKKNYCLELMGTLIRFNNTSEVSRLPKDLKDVLLPWKSASTMFILPSSIPHEESALLFKLKGSSKYELSDVWSEFTRREMMINTRGFTMPRYRTIGFVVNLKEF